MVQLLELIGQTAAAVAVVFGLLFTLGKAAVERWTGKQIDHRFDRLLEEHRHQLHLQSEAARHAMDRDLARHSVYVEKQQLVLAEAFRQLRMAHGLALSLRGYFETLDWRAQPVDVARKLMKARGWPDHKITELLQQWDSDRGRAVHEVLQWEYRWRLDEASKEVQEARNYVLLHELFLPETAVESALELVQALDSFCRIAGPQDGTDTRPLQQESEERMTRVRREFRLILESSRAENAREAPEALVGPLKLDERQDQSSAPLSSA